METIFNNKENSCFAEFMTSHGFEIYNLTHNKIIQTSSGISEDYNSTKDKIFGYKK